jgi:aspartate racemase
MDDRLNTTRLDTVELLSHLKGLGVNLSVSDGRLIIDAPQGAIPPEMKAELSRRKPELLGLLAAAAGPAEAPAPPLESIPREGALPLSFAQERLWFLSLLEPENTAYNISSAYRLTGSLRVGALERSLEEIVRRHEALRTRFREVDGAPVQVIVPPAALRLPVVDLSARPADEREAEIARLNAQEAGRPFRIAEEPPRRFLLARCGPEEHVLIVILHHIVSDGWSYRVFLRELEAIYSAFRQEAPSPLPELKLQYVDYAAWQRAWLQGEALAQQLDYWTRKLSGGTPVLRLPTDRPRPAVQTHRGAVHLFEVGARLTGELKRLGQSHGATLFMTLLAAFEVLLFRYTGQTDFGVGSPIANRSRPELEDLIGLFVNTLVLRADLADAPAFTEVLSRVRATTLEAYEHPDMPFEKLVQELKPPRDMSHSPLFQVMFILQNFPEPEPGRSGLTISSLELDTGSAMFDITVYMWEEAGKLFGSFEYNTDLFDRSTVARMAAHYTRLLAEIVDHPDRAITRLALLPPGEHRQVVVEWNATDRPLADQTLVDLFEAQVARSTEATALRHRGERLSYAELDRRSARLADHLTGLGVGPESLVGIWMERSLDLVVGLLGILRAGGAYVPLDPSYPRERLRFMLEDARVPVLLTEARFVPELPPFAGIVVCLDRDRAAIDAAPPVSRQRPGMDQPCYAIYTSGSTGTPKGVLGLHRGAVNRLQWMWRVYPFAAGEVACQKTYLSFVDSVWEIFGPLLQGVPSLLIPEEAVRDPRRLVAELAAGRVTRIVLVPSLLRVLLEETDDPARRLPDLRLWVTSGEALPPDLARLFRARMPHASLLNLYGSSEVSADVTAHAIEAGLADVEVPIGRPIDNTQLYVLDAGMHPVPVGVTGELYVGGAGLARGYLNRPDLTAERFLPGSFRAGQVLFRTGDLVRYRPDGCLLFLGRRDHQVKVRGFRVELAEVEAALREHPAVTEAAVAAMPDASGDARLVGYVAVDPSAPPSVNDLQAFLRRRLPDYMLPSGYRLLESLPLTPNGKIDRRALPAVTEPAAPREGRPVDAADPLQEQLRDLWQSVLKLERVGVTDNFFDLGGHSLLAARLFSKIEKTLGFNLPLAALFEAPTIERLADVIRERTWAAAWSSLVPIRPGGSRPPLFLVHGAGGNVLLYRDLADRLGPDQPVYGLQCRGLDGGTPPAGRFEEMAADYLREIRALQPEGPYYLGGYCLGGALALEMARQLIEAGQAVALVAMIETYNFHAAPALPFYYDPFHKAQNLKFHWENLRLLSWDEKKEFLAVKIRTEWERLKLRTAIASARVARALRLPWHHRYPHVNVSRLNDAAHAAYAPRPYPGTITLFRPRCHYAGYDERDFGWGGVALGGVDVYELPVNPRGSLVRPFVDRLAEALTTCLQSLQNAPPAAGPPAAATWATGAEAHATNHDRYRWCGHH